MQPGHPKNAQRRNQITCGNEASQKKYVWMKLHNETASDNATAAVAKRQVPSGKWQS